MIHRQIRLLLHGGFRAEITVYGMVSLFSALFKVGNGGGNGVSLLLSRSVSGFILLGSVLLHVTAQPMAPDKGSSVLLVCLEVFTVSLVQLQMLLRSAAFCF